MERLLCHRCMPTLAVGVEPGVALEDDVTFAAGRRRCRSAAPTCPRSTGTAMTSRLVSAAKRGGRDR